VELVAALKARGEATVENIAAMSNLANAQSFALAVDDEMITKIQKIGLDLGKVAIEDMPAYVKAVLGGAETTGKSAEAMAKAVAMWTAGATPKIRGLNVEIDKGASAHDKLNALIPVTAGGYQALIDKSNTFEGSQTKINTAWGNTLSALGNMITTSPAVINLLQDTAKWIQQGAEWLQEHPDAITKAGEKVKEWFAGDGPVQSAFRDTLSIIHDIKAAFDWISEHSAPAAPKVHDYMGKATIENTQGDLNWIPGPNSPNYKPAARSASRASSERGTSGVARTASGVNAGGTAQIYIAGAAPGFIQQLALAINTGGALRAAEAGSG
jgi:hypothetical protein